MLVSEASMSLFPAYDNVAKSPQSEEEEEEGGLKWLRNESYPENVLTAKPGSASTSEVSSKA